LRLISILRLFWQFYLESISAETSSNSYQGGYAIYWRMARAAKDGSLTQEGTTDFENLKNACAEVINKAIVTSNFQKYAPPQRN
jgi:hypothetical protein